MFFLVLPLASIAALVALLFATQYFNRIKFPPLNIDQLLQSFHSFEQEISENQHWVLVAVEQGVRIWERQNQGGFKCEVVINAPMEIIARVLEVPTLEKEWNPSIEKIEVLDHSKDGAHHLHTLRVTPRGFSRFLNFILLKRVFTVTRIRETSANDDEFYIMMKSVLPNDPEPSFPYVRGKIRQAGYKVKRLDRTSSHVTFSLDQGLGIDLFPFTLLEGRYTKRMAFQTALGLKEFFSHVTLTDISVKIYELTKDDPTFQPQKRGLGPKISTSQAASSTANEREQRLVNQGKHSVQALLKVTADESGWTPLPPVSNIQIKMRKTEGNGIAGVMGTGVVEAPPRAVLDCVMNIKEKKKVDTMFAEGRIVDTINEHATIVYQAYEPVWPTTARDFLSLQYWTKFADGSYVLAVTETTHPQCADRHGYVRGAIILAGYVLRPKDDGLASDVTYYAMTDLKGNVPLSVVNHAIQKNPLVIEGIRKYLSGMNLSSYFESSQNAEGDAPADDEIPPFPETPTKDPVPDDIAEALDKSFRDLLRESAPDQEKFGWVFVETKKDIRISRKIADNSPAHCFKGEGVIDRPMTEIRDYLLTVSARPKYDSMCKKIRCVQEYDNMCQLIHTVHTTTQCLLKTEREFLFATQYRVDEATNKHLVVAKSVERDELCPRNPEMVRGDIVMAGWILTPNGRSTQITYIVQVDLKGKIPTSVVNLVSVKQPLCIHYLRRAMDGDFVSSDSLDRKGSTTSTSSN